MVPDARKHTVNIAEGAEKATVTPGDLHLTSGDSVVLATMQHKVLVWFPRGHRDGDQFVFDPQEMNGVSFAIAPGEPVTLTLTAKAEGNYPYAVLCLDRLDFAVGGSPPRMIFEPPG